MRWNPERVPPLLCEDEQLATEMCIRDSNCPVEELLRQLKASTGVIHGEILAG